MEEILNMMQEIWKPIINYEGLYEISNYGRIKRLHKDKRYESFKILKPTKDKDGYLAIILSKNNIKKRYRVHRLVLENFVGPPPFFGAITRHSNNKRDDNFVNNLKWGTIKENIQDEIDNGTFHNQKGCQNNNAKLNDKKIIQIHKLIEANILTQVEIGKLLGVSQATISHINTGKLWRE